MEIMELLDVVEQLDLLEVLDLLYEIGERIQETGSSNLASPGKLGDRRVEPILSTGNSTDREPRLMIAELSWAALAGLRFVAAARSKDSMYRLDWARALVAVRSGASRPPGALVEDLRMRGRMLGGFLDPLEDALFLTVALRRLGLAASFHVGRELVPQVPPAGLFAWVQCGDEVVSTSLPVREQYVEVLCVPTVPSAGSGI